MPWILGGLIVAALLVFGIRKYLASRKPVVQYETVKVERGSIVSRVTATGTLSALVTVQVGSQVSGRIKALYADFNSPVTKGMLLAKIDPQLFQANLAQANANLTAARGQLARAEAQATIAKVQYDRSKQLREKNLIAQADVDTALATMLSTQADVQAAHGSVEQAKAAVKQSGINLAYTDIVSPVDGIVISRNVDVGQTVAASLQAPVIFTIAEDLRKMQVDSSVAEADVGKLEPKMPATFTVDAFPSTKFKGTVRQIRNAPVTVQNVVTYDAVIDVDNPDLKLRPGMTATVTFVYAERPDALRVSNAALRYRPPPELLGQTGTPSASASGRSRHTDAASGGGPPPDRKVVWLLVDGMPQRVPIKTGISDGTYTELVEGSLKEGDVLVTGTSGGAATGSPGGSPGGGAAPAQQRPGGMGRIL